MNKVHRLARRVDVPQVRSRGQNHVPRRSVPPWTRGTSGGF